MQCPDNGVGQSIWNYIRFGVDVLYDGMLVDFGIYFCYKGKMILLCRDLVLNRSKIESIKATMNFCKNIYVDKENHQKIMKDTEYFSKAQAKLEYKAVKRHPSLAIKC